MCYDGHVQRLALLGFLVGCGSKEPPQEAPPPKPAGPGEWQCFTRDPGDRSTPEASTHTRQRVIDGRIESDAVYAGFATRLVLRPVGDHLEGTASGTQVIGRLLVADGSHWTLSIPGKFDEDSTIGADGVLTVTTMSGGQKSVLRYVPASCDVVVAELAKYPAP